VTVSPPLQDVRSVLFICLGNICRSPMAQGIFVNMAQSGRLGEMSVDSAATGDWNTGNPPDPRAIAQAAQHGIDISDQRARRISAADFDRFDLILAMDRRNLAALRTVAPEARRDRIHLFMALALDREADVPDPNAGGARAFQTVFRLLSEGCASLGARMLLSDQTG